MKLTEGSPEHDAVRDLTLEVIAVLNRRASEDFSRNSAAWLVAVKDLRAACDERGVQLWQ